MKETKQHVIIKRTNNEQRKIKGFDIHSTSAIGEYNDTLDSNLLDKADDLLEYALKELEE